MRFRITAFVACLAFVLWTVPLGVFIRPAEEGKSCGGKRAFHMCHMKGKATSPAGPALSAAQAPQAMPDAPGSASSDMLIGAPPPDLWEPVRLFSRNSFGLLAFLRETPGRPPNPVSSLLR